MTSYQEFCKLADGFEIDSLPSVVDKRINGDAINGEEVFLQRSQAIESGYRHCVILPLDRDSATGESITLEKYFKTQEDLDAFVRWICHKIPIQWANVYWLNGSKDAKNQCAVYESLSLTDYYRFKRETSQSLQCEIKHETW